MKKLIYFNGDTGSVDAKAEEIVIEVLPDDHIPKGKSLSNTNSQSSSVL